MKVQVLYIDECPNWADAGELTKKALSTLGLADSVVENVLISTAEEAASVPFAGSPTILLDGQDLFPSDGHCADLACRIYRTDRGLAGVPTQEQLEAAIRSRLA